MAPRQEPKIEQPVLSWRELKTSIARLEEYYKLYNIRDDHIKISRAKITADNEVLEALSEIKITPSEWEKFKEILTEEKRKRAVKKILIMGQRHDETLVEWIDRIQKTIWEYDVPRILAFRVIIANTRNEKDRDICELTLKSRCKTNVDWEEGIESLKNIKSQEDYEKRMRDINKRNAKERIKKRNKGAHKERIFEVNHLITEDKKVKKEEIKVNGKPKEVIIDTGSEVNLIDKNVTLEESLRIEKTSPTKVTTITGEKIISSEKVQATLEKEGVIVNTDFIVAKTQKPELILIGNPTIEEMNKKDIEIKKLIKEFPSVFDDKPSEGYKDQECEIETEPGKCVRIKQRKIPQALLEGARKTINHLEEVGYIEKSSSSWYNPIKPVIKPNGEVRITSNMQFLNNLTADNKYSIPNIQRVIEKCCNKKWFTVLDLKDGYYQIKLKKEHRFKTAFFFENRLYQWTRMPQGFKNSPAIFQNIMDEVLRNEIGRRCNVYLDDIIVYGENEHEHDKNLSEVLKRLQENNLKINPRKMQYKQESVKLLGCMIDGRTKRPITEKKVQILEFKEPKDKKEIQRFLGFVNYYRSYIKNCAEISAPLYELIKKGRKYEWKEEHKKAFEQLKEMVNSEIAIYIPDFDKQFILKTDASNEGIGAVLQQMHNGKAEVVDWASKKLTEAEKKYGITEKEFLALGWAIEHYDYYLRGRKFKAITDHTAIIAMKTKPIFGNLKLERMRERLQEYDFEIEYIKGKDLVDADAISRIHQKDEEEPTPEKNKNLLIGADNIWYWKMDDNTLRIFPKVEERQEIMRKAHEESTLHRGTDTMLYEIKKKYYWKKMESSVKEYLKNCEECIRNHQKCKGGETFIATNAPLEKIAVDLLYVSQREFVLMVIDYFTRLVKCKFIETKETETVTQEVERIIDQIGTPEMIIADPGKEFNSETFKKMCLRKKINLHLICAEKHNENGRVERVNREMWQAIRKTQLNNKEKKIEEITEEFERKHNNSFHRGIQMTPNEAWNNPECKELKMRNSEESKYKKEFNSGRKEEFEENDKVAIEGTEIERKAKATSRFEKTGRVIWKLRNNTYLVKTRNRILKKSHSQLKKL